MELVSRARRDSGSAWRELYVSHFDFVYGVARKLGTPPEEIEDVVQDVFLVVFRKIDTFRQGRLSTWIYRICANVVSDRHRRRRVRRRFASLESWLVPKPTPAPTPEQNAERVASQRAVRLVLEKMAAKKREVLALYEIDGLSGDEIAERLGCPPATVRTRLYHARREFLRLARRHGALEPEVES
jgi:RNA polymerase sigma-70 factor (ECF subfamily)